MLTYPSISRHLHYWHFGLQVRNNHMNNYTLFTVLFTFQFLIPLIHLHLWHFDLIWSIIQIIWWFHHGAYFVILLCFLCSFQTSWIVRWLLGSWFVSKVLLSYCLFRNYFGRFLENRRFRFILRNNNWQILGICRYWVELKT